VTYKDKVRQREYQREWASRKRKGLETKIVNSPQFSEEKRKERRNKTVRSYKKRQRDNRKNCKINAFGSICFICKSGKYKLILHRKDGKAHKSITHMNNEEFERLLVSNKYVHLCYVCHRGTHFAMDKLNLDWLGMLALC